jgi:DNA-directed RNA polymerase sigma subunit (sigma70/sigma32)
VAQMSPWYEDYYAGSSDYPIFHKSAEAVYLTEEHEEPPESSYVAELTEALGRLTDKQRFVVELSWGLRGGQGHSHYEIAEMMGITRSSVYGIYCRAMVGLRGLLNSP